MEHVGRLTHLQRTIQVLQTAATTSKQESTSSTSSSTSKSAKGIFEKAIFYPDYMETSSSTTKSTKQPSFLTFDHDLLSELGSMMTEILDRCDKQCLITQGLDDFVYNGLNDLGKILLSCLSTLNYIVGCFSFTMLDTTEWLERLMRTATTASKLMTLCKGKTNQEGVWKVLRSDAHRVVATHPMTFLKKTPEELVEILSSALERYVSKY